MERLTASRTKIAQHLHQAAPHMRPLLLACRDFGCAFLVVAQSSERFSIPGDRPTICIIGDDLDCALGPAGYDAESLRRIIGTCLTGAVISCAPVEQVYADAASVAVLLRSHALIVETRLECEQEWVEFVRSANPKLPNTIATVKHAGRA